jgi:hypothetical protein
VSARASRAAALAVAVAIAGRLAVARADEPPPLKVAAPAPSAAITYHPLVLPDSEPLPLPPLPEPSGRSWYTARDPYLRPSLRLALGGSARVAGETSANGPPFAFTMDVMAGGHFGLHPGKEQFGLIPEIGYTLRAPGGENQVSAGLGLAYGMGMAYHTVALFPRLVLDPSHGSVGVGERLGLLWCFRENGFSTELAYQRMEKAGVTEHDVRATLGIDLALLALVVGGKSSRGL